MSLDQNLTHGLNTDRRIDALANVQRFSHKAMATIYEVLILHEDRTYAGQAVYEAFAELDRLEQELSRFIENSDISRINKLTHDQSVTVGLAAFECLQLSAEMHERTAGAFDVTVGPLLKCWLNPDKSLRAATEAELLEARERTGFHHLQIDESSHSVRVYSGPVHVDLGGIGKGYAVDQLVELLSDWGIDTALIHGGASSVYALGAPPEMPGWPVTVSSPGNSKQVLARLHLRDKALSGSGLQKGQHIIDPRSGRPVQGNVATWACTAKAAAGDALSTAFMVMNPTEIAAFHDQHPEVSSMIITKEDPAAADTFTLLRFGNWEDITDTG